MSVPRSDRTCRVICREFYIADESAHIVVLDSQGETLDQWHCEEVAGCSSISVENFPEKVAERIEQSLVRKVTIQELHRRWNHNRADMAAFDTLVDRLRIMQAYPMLRALCREAVRDRQLPREIRTEFRIREFLHRREDPSENIYYHPEARERFLRDGECLLVACAAHPRAMEIFQVLLWDGFQGEFDVPAKSAQLIARLEQLAKQRSNPEHLILRIAEARQVREQWIENQHLQQHWIAATLGDAHATVQLYSHANYRQHPDGLRRLREANAKLRREAKLHAPAVHSTKEGNGDK